MRRIQLLGIFGLSLTLALVGYLGLSFRDTPRAQAASIIVVNSKADDTSDDGECTLREAIIAANTDLVSGASPNECIAGSGADTIEFDITGVADYTLGAASGYTITLGASLPVITTSISIQGYTQTDAVENSAVSPAPLNGKLLIEVDGVALANASTDSCFRINNANGVTLRGLVIVNCGADGINILNNSINTVVQGNYIGLGYDDGTDLATVKQPNGQDVVGSASGNGIQMMDSTYLTVGGSNPADRNVISGNQFSEILIDSNYLGSNPNDPTESNHTTVKGNYFGLAADGLTAMPCGYEYGHGNSLLITHSSDDIIGGTEVGARNVIASSKEYGISFRNGSRDSVVEGNYIGTDYTGMAAVSHVLGTGHPEAGVSVAMVSVGGYSLASHNIRVGGPTAASANVVSGNVYNGGLTGRGIFSHDDAYNVTIQHNIVGLGADGVTSLGNNGDGISVFDALSAVVSDNIVANNATATGIFIGIASDIQVMGNTVTNNGIGIAIYNSTDVNVGSASAGDRNIIYGSLGDYNVNIVGSGSVTERVFIQGNYIGVNSSGNVDGAITQKSGVIVNGMASNSVIGGSQPGEGNIIAGGSGSGVIVSGLDIDGIGAFNPAKVSIIGNSIHSMTPSVSTAGIGIDHIVVMLNGSFVVQSVDEVGPTPNDTSDPDTGPNNFMNFPILHSADQVGTTLNLTYDLDATDSPSDSYRVEFFANDTADASGYGEGQTFLGAITSSNGTGQFAAITIPASLNLSGKSISATTTAIDNTTTSGFGSTSEFGPVLTASYTAVTLADTGENVWTFLAGASALIVLAGGLLLSRRYSRSSVY